MPAIPCPVCKEGEVEYEIQQDQQGVDAWTMTYYYLEWTNQSCKCEIPPELLDPIEADILKNPTDYYDYEPIIFD